MPALSGLGTPDGVASVDPTRALSDKKANRFAMAWSEKLVKPINQLSAIYGMPNGAFCYVS